MDNSQIDQIILSGDFSQLQAAFDSLMQEINETRAGLTGLKKTSDEYKAVTQQIYKAEQDLIKVFDKADDKIDLNSKSYRELNAVLVDLRKQYKEVGEEGIRNEFVPSIQKLDKEMKNLDSRIGLHQRNVGNYEGAMRNVQMATAQVVRELPSLGMSAQTFFLAISNNIPILMDAVKNLNNLGDAAGGTTSKFGKFKGGLKAIGSALMSWQTLIIVGITLLISYGDEISTWARKVFEANKEGADYAKTLERLNKKYKEGIGEAAPEVNNLETYAQILDGTIKTSPENIDKAARKVAKVLKLEADETNLAAIKNGEYTESINEAVKALEKQKLAEIALKDAQDSVEKRLPEEEQLRQGVKLNGWQKFWSSVFAHSPNVGIDDAQNIAEAQAKTLDKKIEKIQKNIKKLNEEATIARQEAAKFDLSDFLGDGDEDGKNGKEAPWESYWEKRIRYEEAIRDSEKAADFKFTQEGRKMYENYFNELLGHYEKNTKEYDSALKQRILHQEEFAKRQNELRAELDLYPDPKDPKSQLYSPTQLKKELVNLETWYEKTKDKLNELGLWDGENGFASTFLKHKYNNELDKLKTKYSNQYQPEADFIKKRNTYLETTLALTKELSQEKLMELDRDERLANIEKERAKALQSLKERGVIGADGNVSDVEMASATKDLNRVFDEKAKKEWSKFFLDSLELALADIREVTNAKVNMAAAFDVKPFESYYTTHKKRVSSIGSQRDAYSSGMDEQISAVDEQLLNRKQLTADAIVALEEKKNNLIKEKDKQLAEFQRNLDQENLDFKIESNREIADSVVQSMSSLSSIFGSIGDMMSDNEEEQQKWYIAQTVMGTASGMAAAISSPIMNAAGPAGWVAAGLQAAAVLASGIASIASIKSKDLGSVGKGQDKIIPNEQEYLTMSPLRTITGLSEMDEINKPIKVYVTEKDITDTQNKVKVKESETTW